MKKVEFKFDERSLESVEKLRRQGIEVPTLPEKAEETVTPKNEVTERNWQSYGRFAEQSKETIRPRNTDKTCI